MIGPQHADVPWRFCCLRNESGHTWLHQDKVINRNLYVLNTSVKTTPKRLPNTSLNKGFTFFILANTWHSYTVVNWFRLAISHAFWSLRTLLINHAITGACRTKQYIDLRPPLLSTCNTLACMYSGRKCTCTCTQLLSSLLKYYILRKLTLWVPIHM